MESLCFPNDGNLEVDLFLKSLVGNTEDTHPTLSSTQALAAALKAETLLAINYIHSNYINKNYFYS